MMAGGSKDQLMSDINVTPLVDVMLVLLIIFMVTAPMMMQGVDVSLPEASSRPLPAETDQLVITINRDGQIFIDDYEVSLGFLQEKLTKVVENRKNREVYLKADQSISYGRVVRVMSEIKAAGIEKLGMVTEPISDDERGRRKKTEP